MQARDAQGRVARHGYKDVVIEVPDEVSELMRSRAKYSFHVSVFERFTELPKTPPCQSTY